MSEIKKGRGRPPKNLPLDEILRDPKIWKGVIRLTNQIPDNDPFYFKLMDEITNSGVKTIRGIYDEVEREYPYFTSGNNGYLELSNILSNPSKVIDLIHKLIKELAYARSMCLLARDQRDDLETSFYLALGTIFKYDDPKRAEKKKSIIRAKESDKNRNPRSRRNFAVK